MCCGVLQCIAPAKGLVHVENTLHHNAPPCNTLQHTTTLCNTLQRTAPAKGLVHESHHCRLYTSTHCNRLQQTATDCDRLQQTAIHCNRQQQTATHRTSKRSRSHEEHLPPLLHNVAVCCCSVLQYFAACCSILHRQNVWFMRKTHSNTQQQTALAKSPFHGSHAQHAAARRNTLQHAATRRTGKRFFLCVTHSTRCNTLQHAATRCNTLQHPAPAKGLFHVYHTCRFYTNTHCNRLQQTATDCNRLQQTATDCNRLHRQKVLFMCMTLAASTPAGGGL